jgi:hypothetical protein
MLTKGRGTLPNGVNALPCPGPTRHPARHSMSDCFARNSNKTNARPLASPSQLVPPCRTIGGLLPPNDAGAARPDTSISNRKFHY